MGVFRTFKEPVVEVKERDVRGRERSRERRWVSLSRSGKSLTIRVLNQLFFVPLRDLDSVLKGDRNRADIKQWVEQRKEEWEEEEDDEEW